MSIEHSRSRIIADGAVAGILGAGAVALWFLIFDAARGHPFETPAILGAAILHGGSEALGRMSMAQLVGEYTVLHFLAFVMVGILGALLLEAAEKEPSLNPSLLIFLVSFESFFVALAMFLGPAVMSVLTWWAILIANLLATAVMLAYFLMRHPSIARSILGPWLAVVRDGIAAGLVGGVTMMAWFLLHDLALRTALHTPILLGTALLGAKVSAGAGSVPVVLGYTLLHFGGFVAFGLMAAILVAAMEKEPLLGMGVLMLFVVFEVFFLGWVTLVDAWVLGRVGWWAIVIGNLLALVAMGTFFLKSHPRIVIRVRSRWRSQERDATRYVRG